MTKSLEAAIPVTDVEKAIIVAVNILEGKLPNSKQEFTKEDITNMIITKVVSNTPGNSTLARAEVFLTLKKEQ